MKGVIFLLVNVVVLLSLMLFLFAGEIGYLESKVDSFDELAEDYRKMLHRNMKIDTTYPGYIDEKLSTLFKDFKWGE